MPITKEQYEKLTDKRHDIEITLFDQRPRTLIYGYTCDRNTFHVYLDEEGCVNKFIYDYYDKTVFYKKYELLTNLELSELMPDKRVYPESTDYEFLKILLSYDVYVPFTTYNEQRYERVKDLDFHGEVYSE